MALGLFPAFFDSPTGMKYGDLDEGETMELVLRQHWIKNIHWIIVTVIGFLAPVAVLLVDSLSGVNFLPKIPERVVMEGFTLWFLFILAYATQNFLYWYFNVYIVTNLHIIDVDFNSLLSKKVTEAQFADIESVSSQISGALQTFYNFGDVVIETASKDMKIKFEGVPRPDAVVNKIQQIEERRPNRAEWFIGCSDSRVAKFLLFIEGSFSDPYHLVLHFYYCGGRADWSDE